MRSVLLKASLIKVGTDDNVDDQPDGEDAGEVLEEEEGGGQASDKKAEGHQP